MHAVVVVGNNKGTRQLGRRRCEMDSSGSG
jgi:hypothetical protein